MGGYAPVGRHRQHVAQTVAADRPPAVGGQRHRLRHRPPTPAGTFAATARSISVIARAGLVAKPRLSSGIPASLPAVQIVGPGLGQVQCAVDQSVPARGGVGQIHRHLGVLNPARGTAVLALHPDRMSAFLDVAGLVNNQDRTGSPNASIT